VSASDSHFPARRCAPHPARFPAMQGARRLRCPAFGLVARLPTRGAPLRRSGRGTRPARELRRPCGGTSMRVADACGRRCLPECRRYKPQRRWREGRWRAPAAHWCREERRACDTTHTLHSPCAPRWPSPSRCGAGASGSRQSRARQSPGRRRNGYARARRAISDLRPLRRLPAARSQARRQRGPSGARQEQTGIDACNSRGIRDRYGQGT